MHQIDLRSDTVTQPTPAMREAMFAAALGDDCYGDDPTTNELEALAARVMGKEAALFVPSGTFGNQLSIKTHCATGTEVILYEDTHIIAHEAAAAAVHSRVQMRTLEGKGSRPDVEQMERRIRKVKDVHEPYTGLLCLENAHSNGEVIAPDAMRQIYALAQHYHIPLHLDGARIFNAASYLGVPVTQVSQYADSVMFCLSKGLCAPIGSILAGSAEFITRAHRNRKQMGGGLRQSGVITAAGIVALTQMVERLAHDHARAQRLTAGLAALKGIAIEPRDVHINLVWFSLATQKQALRVFDALTAANILANEPEQGKLRLATHHGITDADIKRTLEVIATALVE
ncbi:MAG: aminotransferase class I/II-fold pyridoxal phosphate-dependent enzyme [Coriobacteriales bacterium]|jgi:threonine aldolase|nr:aminotransferase class I/II-fold pyridoxal phosphate-dependent enzyme [Coriobacteriales bacterium]